MLLGLSFPRGGGGGSLSNSGCMKYQKTPQKEQSSKCSCSKFSQYPFQRLVLCQAITFNWHTAYEFLISECSANLRAFSKAVKTLLRTAGLRMSAYLDDLLQWFSTLFLEIFLSFTGVPPKVIKTIQNCECILYEMEFV